MKQYIWLLQRSLYLDLQLLLEVPDISWSSKIVFIYSKYVSIIWNAYNNKKSIVKKGKSFNGDFYFNDEFATGLLQSIYCHNYFLRSHLPSAPVVVDIGANIGQFYAFSKHYLGASTIISFEPIKRCFDTLKLNSTHTVINAAIGPQDCEQEIFIDDRDIFASLVKPKAPMSDRVSSQMVRVLRLDTVQEIADLKYIDLLKIDTEGYELEVLRSARLTVQKCKYILIECSLDRPNSGGLDEVYKFILKVFPELIIVDIFSNIRKNNKLEWVEILWKNTKLV